MLLTPKSIKNNLNSQFGEAQRLLIYCCLMWLVCVTAVNSNWVTGPSICSSSSGSASSLCAHVQPLTVAVSVWISINFFKKCINVILSTNQKRSLCTDLNYSLKSRSSLGFLHKHTGAFHNTTALTFDLQLVVYCYYWHTEEFMSFFLISCFYQYHTISQP